MSSTSGSSQRSTGRTVLAVILGIIAVWRLVAAIMYLALPAKSLSFLPGHIAGSTGHHPLRRPAVSSSASFSRSAPGSPCPTSPSRRPLAANDRESSPAGRS